MSTMQQMLFAWDHGTLQIASSGPNFPYINAYTWDNNYGFKTKYANPSTLPGGRGNDVAFSPLGTDIAIAHQNTPYIAAYPWVSGVGFGTKYATPATIPLGTGNGVMFSPDNLAVAFAHSANPYMSVYPWTPGTGFGTRYATQGSIVGISSGNQVAFSPASNAIAVMDAGVNAYPWNSVTGFGTRYANPTTLAVGNSLSFSPAGGSIAMSNNNNANNSVFAYPWSAVSGFGTKYANPSTATTVGMGNAAVCFSPTSNVLAVGYFTPDYINAYAWVEGSGFGTKYAVPTSLPAGFIKRISFAPTNTAIALASDVVTSYPWSSNGFGLKYAPASGATFQDSVAFSPVISF